MSKAHDPHWRYVAFRITAPTPLSRRAVDRAVQRQARAEGVPEAEVPQLTRYAWPHAVVRLLHIHLDDARTWLPRIDAAVEAGARVPVTVETLSSSGTIKALTTRLGILTERGAPPPSKAAGRGPGPRRAASGAVAPPARSSPRRQGSSVPPPRGR